MLLTDQAQRAALWVQAALLSVVMLAAIITGSVEISESVIREPSLLWRPLAPFALVTVVGTVLFGHILVWLIIGGLLGVGLFLLTAL